MQMQQVGFEAVDRLSQQPRKARTHRRVQEKAMARSKGDLDAVMIAAFAAMASRLGVRKQRRGNAATRQGQAQIGGTALDAAGMRRMKLADVQDAHRATWRQ